MRKILGKILLLILVIGLSSGMGKKPEEFKSSQEKQELMPSATLLGIQIFEERVKVRDFKLKDLSGKEVNLSDYYGKLVFLNFWATWCPPCREEMPSMEKLYQRFKDEDFVMLAVDLRESQSTVKDFAREYKLNFPILLDLTGKIGDTYGVRAIPTTYLIDRQGKLIGKAVGARDWASQEAFELIEHLLEE